MSRTITKDILTVEHGIICHQVNCQGVMGAGLAKVISDKWPAVKEDYLARCNSVAEHNGTRENNYFLLGGMLETWVGETLVVTSIFGQDQYGRGECHTRYLALASGFSRIRARAQALPVYIPHGIGCGLAGGDWHVVSALIEQELPDAVICRKS